MTSFKDVGGLTEVKAIKIAGASKWVGSSSVAGALDTTSEASLVFSHANHLLASHGSLFDCQSATVQQCAQRIGQLEELLAKLGIGTLYYDGTNQVN